MPYSAAVFTRKKTDHLVDINKMTLRVGKELYKKLNIVYVSIFIINKYNPSLSAINFLPQCIRNEYIAVFVCRGMGKKWGKLLVYSLFLILQRRNFSLY